MDVIFHYRGYITAAIALVLLWVAWRRGGQPEKACAGTLVGMMVVLWSANLIGSAGRAMWYQAEFVRIELLLFSVDLVGFLALGAVSLRANRIYPLWLAGFQLVALGSHLPRGIGPDIHPVAYASFVYGPWYFELAALGFGVWFQTRRYERGYVVRDWRARRQVER